MGKELCCSIANSKYLIALFDTGAGTTHHQALAPVVVPVGSFDRHHVVSSFFLYSLFLQHYAACGVGVTLSARVSCLNPVR